MRIAIIDHVGNPGGGCRYLRNLLLHLRAAAPALQMTFFGNPVSIARENLRAEFTDARIDIQPLRSLALLRPILKLPRAQYLVQAIQRHFTANLTWLPTWLTGAVHQELESKLRNFDLAFFPWPYFLRLPRLSIPMVAVFHDMNFRYQFSGSGFAPESLKQLDADIPQWLERTTPIVSTHFIRSEVEKFYPGMGAKTHVIHLGPLSQVDKPLELTEARRIVDALGVPQNYLLYPTNISPHKNLGPLFSAIHLLNIPLVLIGYGTERLHGRACDIGLVRNAPNPNVFGLGYLTNRQTDALIRCARIVVSTSLYEAGNGPGLDAWHMGTPVAMSNIPAFLEHCQIQGVKAQIFDPRSPRDIADKLDALLANPALAAANAQHSREAIASWSWPRVAAKYLDVFHAAR